MKNEINEELINDKFVGFDVGNRIRTKSLCIDWIINTQPDIIFLSVGNVNMGMIPYIEKSTNLNDGVKLVYLIPDVVNSKIAILPYCNNHAQIFGSFYELNTVTSKLEPWSQCPREILKKSIDKPKCVLDKIPSSLLESLQHFKQDKYLIDHLGAQITSTIINLSEEVDHDLSKLSIEETILKLLEIY